MSEASNPLDPMTVVVIVAAILVMMASSYIMLFNADRIRRIGRMGAYALSRITGLILAAVAVQFIILGVQDAYLEYFRAIL